MEDDDNDMGGGRRRGTREENVTGVGGEERSEGTGRAKEHEGKKNYE